jgi:hypothetical protein
VSCIDAIWILLYSSGIHSSAPGNLLEMQNLSFHPDMWFWHGLKVIHVHIKVTEV